MEDPMRLRAGTAVPLAEVEVRTSRSSGPGGQHANVTASRVEVAFDVETSVALSGEEKRLIMERVGARVTAAAQDTRSQSRNRELALERLRERLAGALVVRPARRPTQPGRGAKERRLAAKRRRADVKRGRRPPPPDEGV